MPRQTQRGELTHTHICEQGKILYFLPPQQKAQEGIGGDFGLKALREIVARLGGELRDLEERLAEGGRHALARHQVLGDGANGAEHGQAAVLDFLQLLFLVLFLGVVQAKGVPAAGHPPALVSGRAVALEAALVAAAFQGAREDENLNQGQGRRLVEGVDGVHLAEVVLAHRREVAHGRREHEAKPRQLRHTAVLELRLAVPAEGVEWRV